MAIDKSSKRRKKDNRFSSIIYRIYPTDHTLDKTESRIRNITFQVTDDCPMACTYCYQRNKGHKKMSKETAKKAVDLLFDLYDKNEGTFINHNTKAIVLDFIGGEPLMNIDVINYICEYFLSECIRRNHPWLLNWRASITSNGALYFDEKVQNFLTRFNGFVSFNITLDGPKEIHDACRIYHDGRGNFDDAHTALQHFRTHYYDNQGTKVTIAPENLHNINKIIRFFVEEGMSDIHANCVHEVEWTIEHGQIFYQELKKMADYLLSIDDDIAISLFDDEIFTPLPETENNNYCGGTGAMLAFDPDGIAYPCLRYMPSSLGKDVPPLICGSVEGVFEKPEHKALKDYLDSITRRSQSSDECFYCPIARGCGWCSAWHYQSLGSPNKRSMNLCTMHKARSLANVYYWNKWYKQQGIDKKMKMWLPEEEALKIISKEEYDMLKKLSDE